MLLPYASDQVPTRRPVVTWALLGVMAALNALVLASDHWAGRWHAPEILATFGLVPARLDPLTLLTYSFFHSGPGHLLVNLFYLWVFGAGVEDAVGRGWFLLLYLAGGVVGGLLQVLVTVTLLPPVSAAVPIVGASAAVATLVGLFAVRYYRARLDFVGLPFRPHVVAVVAVFLAMEIGGGLWDLLSGSPTGGVAHWAHVGGFIFGLACAQALQLDRAGQRAYLAGDATRAMDRNVPGAAIKRWEALLAREPDNATVRAELARAWQLLGDTDQATQHYLQAISTYLANNSRVDAALLYAEMRRQGLRTASPPTDTLFALGAALEEVEQHALAAETLRAFIVRNPNAPEAETALLKVIGLYTHRLDRREEARILLRVFMERYPHSPWRALAEDLRQAAQESPPPTAS